MRMRVMVNVSVRVAFATLLISTLAAAQSGTPPRGDMPPGIPVGTVAPDGIGVTVERSPSAGDMEQGPWIQGTMQTALQAGATMPANSVVRTIEGKPFDLNAAVRRQPTVLIFYRGGWCPYCNAHLRDLQKSMGTLKEMGYQLLAISTDTPQALRKTLDDNALDYRLLSDSQLAVASGFGLKYKVQSAYLDHVKNDKGTDLVAQNGGYLLNPGAFVMDTKGVIRFAYVNRNFTVRISQDALLKAARDALQPQ
jgi:peroxiredoxin